MTKATLDQTLLTLQRAADYLRMTHRNSVEVNFRTMSAADITAIAILEQAARDVLGVRSTQ